MTERKTTAKAAASLIPDPLSLISVLSHSRYQTKVPTDPAPNIAGNTLAPSRTSKVCAVAVTFDTTSTVFPSDVLNATFGSESRLLEPIRTDPGGTNFET